MSQEQPPASILVVDDTIENLRLLASMLGEHAYEIRPVTSGRQALLAVEHDPPDLILLDINMPEMNGYEVCRRLKERPELRGIPVIFLTASTDVDDKVQAFDAGGVDYITKPFELAEVLARVRTHVELRRAQLELSRSYQRLRSLEKLRDDLVHMLVHDMRAPLTVLLGNLSLLESGPAGQLSAEVREDLRGAIQSTDVLTRMANDLLDVSRLEEQQLPLVRTPCDLVALAGAVSASLSGWDLGRRITIDAVEPVVVRCDQALIRRVLENLIGNAIKHTPAGSDVQIAVEADADHARVQVLDLGPGVPPESRQRIFEKFGMLETRQHTIHSAGLGLAFCKVAVEAHGGTIGVDGRDGRGSRFWFALPR